MLSIPQKVLGASLILASIVGVSGCASKDMETSSLKRLLAAKQERIEELEISRSDMQRVIELKNAELKRQRKDGLEAGHESGVTHAARRGDSVLLPPRAGVGECYARVLSPPKGQVAYGTVASRGEVGDGTLIWRPVLCQSHATPETVHQIQRALKQTHHYHGSLDGIYGPQTRRAVESYQRAKGLAVGGITLETLGSLGLKMPDKQVVAGAE